jgi:preprotein translocase subunit SecF
MYKNMNKGTWKKVLYLGLALLIIAGIIVVLLKGFRVDLMLEQHEEITYSMETEYDLKDIRNICNEVFENKKVVVKEIELFGDAVQINVDSVTDEEKTNLVDKMNEKYETENTVDDLKIDSIPNVRIRDWVTPYIKPVAISMLIIIAYVAIRFRKLNTLKLLGELIGKIVITILAILSVVAIIRLPLMPCYITILTAIAVAECVFYLAKYERKLNEEKTAPKKGKKANTK